MQAFNTLPSSVSLLMINRAVVAPSWGFFFVGCLVCLWQRKYPNGQSQGYKLSMCVLSSTLSLSSPMPEIQPRRLNHSRHTPGCCRLLLFSLLSFGNNYHVMGVFWTLWQWHCGLTKLFHCRIIISASFRSLMAKPFWQEESDPFLL